MGDDPQRVRLKADTTRPAVVSGSPNPSDWLSRPGPFRQRYTPIIRTFLGRVKGQKRCGCLTVLGISAGHVVVGLDWIQGRADDRLETFDSGTHLHRQLSADLRAGSGEGLERRQRVAPHRLEVERADRLA